jgi:benzoyl-CoA 2,3-epoxidase subunit B
MALDQSFELDAPDGTGGVRKMSVPLRNAMNEVTRQAYVADCEIGLKRWNRTIQKAGYAIELRLPSTRFRRSIGSWAGVPTAPDGMPISETAFEAGKDGWLPTEADKQFVASLMHPVTEPGKMAGWIAPPDRGVNNLPVDYEYVQALPA